MLSKTVADKFVKSTPDLVKFDSSTAACLHEITKYANKGAMNFQSILTVKKCVWYICLLVFDIGKFSLCYWWLFTSIYTNRSHPSAFLTYYSFLIQTGTAVTVVILFTSFSMICFDWRLQELVSKQATRIARVISLMQVCKVSHTIPKLSCVTLCSSTQRGDTYHGVQIADSYFAWIHTISDTWSRRKLAKSFLWKQPVLAFIATKNE